ncbi:WcbI family polysaccharide biosynthesis putative acetyltransferase [Sphingomonas sp. MMS24-J13]|uniref:WcbI family polysaccharide biosynthesis putative acetyltransferase n=1 Tax=Sphingomonas sp. MMS24-J13 TaxID=3238686 RepID=UPI00384B577A
MSRHVELFTSALFRSRSQRPFRTLVIGNCQSRYLASLFEIALADCACDYIACHEITTDHQRAAIEAYLDEHRHIYRLILTIPLGPEWHAIGRDALIARFGADRLFFLLNLYFSGTHPDQTGLGELGTRTMSPMGGPHSKVALGGWMAGLPLPKS